jgi:hypothetical protein
VLETLSLSTGGERDEPLSRSSSWGGRAINGVVVRPAIRVFVGGVLYLGAVWAVFRLELVQSPTPVPLQWICLLLPAVAYGLFAGSWWALLGPAIVAMIVLLTWTGGIENSESTWGEALAPVILVSSAAAVALGVVAVKGWREGRRPGAV